MRSSKFRSIHSPTDIETSNRYMTFQLAILQTFFLDLLRRAVTEVRRETEKWPGSQQQIDASRMLNII